ncbi:LacI family DNA-binding transcriptional regulator [Marinomonas atlantica]|uniref:LacI family DNA-binding transcriptional regulator n=1 Tax=Marinomonas atlantica TaxID=1806668 RepID=UPI00082E315A|nr:LacI family DNA-binding transcriptional regulator [Marinomonas atlantica]
MKKVNTMEEFAGLAGVSRPTASKYFENPEAVGVRSRQKIEAMLEKVDYRPNMLASMLMRKETKIIGVLIPSLGDPLYAAIVRSIELHAMSFGYSVLIECSYGQPDVEERAIDNLLALKVAGICYAPSGIKAIEGRLQRIQNELPFVFFDASFEGVKYSVQNDNDQSIELITDYMIQSERKPAFFPMPDVNSNANERMSTYKRTMIKHGLEPNVLPVDTEICWDFERWGKEQALKMIRMKRINENGVICANDRIAFGVLSALFSEGLLSADLKHQSIPITGHDNQPLSEFTCPPLTTVAQDVEGIGKLCVEKILSLAGTKNFQLPDEILLKAKLVLRESA